DLLSFRSSRLKTLRLFDRLSTPTNHARNEGTSMIEIASGILGYPRMGSRRELKWALERYWAGQGTEEQLLRQASTIRKENWEAQRRSGASWVAVGDFALYDHVLDLALQLGVIPERFGGAAAARDLQT